MSSVIEVVEILTRRLPELEYRLEAMGKIRTFELPKGLFRASQFSDSMSALVCIQELRADLSHLKSLLEDVVEQTSPAVLYLAKQVSLKMQVLLQLCHQHRRKKMALMQGRVEMKQLVTRQQWINTVHEERERLLSQQSALILALQKNKEKPDAVLTLEHALKDVAGQLSSLKQMLSTLSAPPHP